MVILRVFKDSSQYSIKHMTEDNTSHKILGQDRNIILTLNSIHKQPLIQRLNIYFYLQQITDRF